MDSSVAPAALDETGGGDQKNTKESRKGGWNAAFFIIFVEMAERFAFFGLSGNLITYLTSHLHQPTVTAVKNINTWVGVSSLFPIVGAVVADSYLGRFTTILLASSIYFTGMVLLTLSVSVVPMSHREAVFFTALYVLAVGEGGHKPCVQTFAADQFDEDKPDEKAAKSSFFNWWYLGIVFGASAAVLLVIYIQDNVGWTEGLGILAGALGAALVVFLTGIKTYRKQAPVGSPYTRVAQVVVAAMRNRRVDASGGECIMCYEEEDDVEGKHGMSRTNQFRFLDKAAIMDSSSTTRGSRNRNPWEDSILRESWTARVAAGLPFIDSTVHTRLPEDVWNIPPIKETYSQLRFLNHVQNFIPAWSRKPKYNNLQRRLTSNGTITAQTPTTNPITMLAEHQDKPLLSSFPSPKPGTVSFVLNLSFNGSPQSSLLATKLDGSKL